MKSAACLGWVGAVVISTTWAQAQYQTVIYNSGVEITGYAASNNAMLDVTLAIPDSLNGLPVTSIGSNAFQNCDTLTSVTLPNSVTNIGPYAFENCYNLTRVVFGHNLASIGHMAFSGVCVEHVTIPKSVTSIGDWAFSYCGNMLIMDFKGEPPTLLGNSVFKGDNAVTLYYPLESKGWAAQFGGRPTAVLSNSAPDAATTSSP